MSGTKTFPVSNGCIAVVRQGMAEHRVVKAEADCWYQTISLIIAPRGGSGALNNTEKIAIGIF